jgi:OmpA-OmpF porin, OOP family
MAINILDLFKNQVVGELAKSASGFLGESESSTKGVLESVAPAILGSLIQKGSTQSGASGILDMLTKNNFDTDALGGLSGLTGGGESKFSQITNLGLPIVKMLFGDKLGSIVDWISGNKGVKSSSVSSLISLAAPFLMGLIGKQMKSQNLGLSGLMSLLGGQGTFVKSLLPSGLANLTNFSGFNFDEKVNSSGNGFNFKKMWPWLALLIGLVLLWALLRGCNNKEVMDTTNGMVDTVKTEVTEVVDTAASTVEGAVAGIKGKVDAAGNWVKDLGKEITLLLPDKSELKVGEKSVENKLVEFIKTGTTDETTLKNTWFTFDRLYFEKGKSTLTAESQTQLKNIAAILKAFTKVNIKLGGYTDSDGDDAMNLKLSDQRAKSASFELQKLGVTAKRLASEGYGEQYPVCAENDTPECKSQNRRIDIRVTKM